MIIKNEIITDLKIRSVKDLYKLKPFMEGTSFKINKSLNKECVTVRYETDMGKQAQLDWKEAIPFILDTGEVVEINMFVLLLFYSRFRKYRLSISKSQDILFSFLDDAFETFGGVPKEIVTDNMKTVMDEARTEYFGGKINSKFKQFAYDYGFKVHPCMAGRPRTKAKVEAPMKILDEIRTYNGKLNYRQLNDLIIRINNRVNSQVNQGTGRIPLMYFQKEKKKRGFKQKKMLLIGNENFCYKCRENPI